MNSVVGHTAIYNIIIIFILILFSFIIGTMSYYKAYKINNRIVTAIEKYEGYNNLSETEINRIIQSYGYNSTRRNCPAEYKFMTLVSNSDLPYCVYIDNSNTELTKGDIYEYGVITYMSIDLPLINQINIPVFTRSNRLYKFTSAVIPGGGH